MEIAFDAIGIEIKNQAAFDNLAEDVERRGEVSRSRRAGGDVLHGRCLKLGAEGLEIWTLFYESAATGETAYADCRPAFRARRALDLCPWVLTESDEAAGETIVHGFIDGAANAEVLFALQNLTEIEPRVFEQRRLSVGLCGLAYTAEILSEPEKPFWKSADELALNVVVEQENAWSLSGRVVAFERLKNPVSGTDLYWFYLNLGEFKLEILVNRRVLKNKKIQIGDCVRAEVWLQGHILSENRMPFLYEGIDRSRRTVDFWKQFKKLN